MLGLVQRPHNDGLFEADNRKEDVKKSTGYPVDDGERRLGVWGVRPVKEDGKYGWKLDEYEQEGEQSDEYSMICGNVWCIFWFGMRIAV